MRFCQLLQSKTSSLPCKENWWRILLIFDHTLQLLRCLWHLIRDPVLLEQNIQYHHRFQVFISKVCAILCPIYLLSYSLIIGLLWISLLHQEKPFLLDSKEARIFGHCLDIHLLAKYFLYCWNNIAFICELKFFEILCQAPFQYASWIYLVSLKLLGHIY